MVLIGAIQIVRKSQHTFDPVENNRFLLIAQVCNSLARTRKTEDRDGITLSDESFALCTEFET